MHAITYSRFGAPADVLALTDLPTPDPAPGEVLVEISHSGVNPSDIKARAGARPGVTKPPFDLIVPHSDGAGRVVAVGDGVPQDRIGQSVWIWNGQWQRPFGTAATHICLPEVQAVPLPDGVSATVGATLGIPGLTAAHAVFGGGDVAGKTLLIQGGSGTVGHLAVQLARWGGAQVIATARGAGLDRCTRAGAHHVVDFDSDELAQKVLAANGDAPVDRIVEVEYGLNAATDAEVIAPNGTICAYGSARDMTPTIPFGPMLFKAAKLDIILIYILPPQQRATAISKLHDALSDSALDSPVAQIFALADCHSAHDAVARGARDGAILLEVAT
ncbi:NADPH:quinone reductase [uncultured Tateyamaria sp.]|uniref:NADPH:quinone reductase n=1 Tax=Tateyamaria sp. 1078 TaxID=3417464 RepID=UPI00260F45F3|nr:NADPH:quinone reductase [uncultured Tateyamaria sp.]